MSAVPSGLIIFLVEDSADDVFFFQRALKNSRLEHTLIHVPDGGAALGYLKQAMSDTADAAHPLPDLVFLDLKLPTFSGFEILEWIRAQKNGSALDVTVVSGSEQEEDVARATALGVSAYCVKPVSVEQLRARFASWRERHAGRDVAASAHSPS
jgi:DNA-binding response OmpR family regulator